MRINDYREVKFILWQSSLELINELLLLEKL